MESKVRLGKTPRGSRNAPDTKDGIGEPGKPSDLPFPPHELETYLRFYSLLRDEIYKRHDYLERESSLTLLGLLALLGIIAKQRTYLFLLPAFAAFSLVLYLYHLNAKSRVAAYCRIVEIVLQRKWRFDIPLWETVAGTFSADHNYSRNFLSLWGLRTMLLPLAFVGGVLWFLVESVGSIAQWCVVGYSVAFAVAALVEFVRKEKAAGEWVRQWLSDGNTP